MLVSIGVSALNHLIGHIFMMQMFFFNFGFRFWSLANLRAESIQRFIYSNQIEHFVLMERVLLVSIGVSALNQIIGHIFMMQLFSFNFGF